MRKAAQIARPVAHLTTWVYTVNDVVSLVIVTSFKLHKAVLGALAGQRSEGR